MQQSVLKRKGSFDSQIDPAMFQSKFQLMDGSNKSDEELISYTNEDDVEMIEKQPKNPAIQLYNLAQLHRLSKIGIKDHQEKVQLAATLISQKKIPFITRKAIWVSFIQKDDAKKYFDKTPSQKVEDQIRKDVPRSGNESKMSGFKLSHILYRVLSAYAVYNPKIGYTQGMNIICQQIIILMSLEGNDKDLEKDDFEIVENEEDIFWMFAHLMKSMEDLFIQDVPGIHRRIEILHDMLQNRCNEILVHLQCNSIDNINTCFSQYYFTMLMQKQQKKFARLIFEMYLIFGESFIQNFIAGTLEFYKYKITRMNGLENLMPYFRDQMFPRYYNTLKALKKQNKIIQHFQKQHYFDQTPFYGDYIVWEPKFVNEIQMENSNRKNKFKQMFYQGNIMLKKLIGR